MKKPLLHGETGESLPGTSHGNEELYLKKWDVMINVSFYIKLPGMKSKHIRIMWLMLAILLAVQTHAQEFNPRQVRHARPQYVQLGLGLNRGSMRDFATSPITYKGILFNYSLAYLKMDTAREVKLTARYNQGSYRFKRPADTEPVSKSSQHVLYINYYRLYRLNKLSNNKWNVKIGGMADVNTDVRINEDLMNAGLGYEIFNTFFLSGKASYRFERRDLLHKKFLFIKYEARPMVSFLSYQLNIPVMNNVVRNGYAYIGNEGINGPVVFKDYEVKAFSGFRICSELAYTRQMQNGNMWRVSYLWDAYAVGKKFNRFEMANHIVEFSLLFHLNKNMQK